MLSKIKYWSFAETFMEQHDAANSVARVFLKRYDATNNYVVRNFIFTKDYFYFDAYHTNVSTTKEFKLPAEWLLCSLKAVETVLHEKSDVEVRAYEWTQGS